MICGIDGGKPPKTVFAWSDENGLQVSRKPPVSHFDLVIAEKPAGRIRANRTPASVVSPAGWAMAGLFSVPITEDGMRVWIPTEDWKRKLLGAAWNMKKEAACRNFCDMFGLSFNPENEKDQDVIDAVAIMEAGSRFTRKELKQWVVKF